MKKDYYTKRRIADGLKILNNTKPLDKITVSDITQYADVNRSTFYYYFADKYQLIEWIIQDDIVSHFTDVAPDNWMDNTLLLLNTIKEDISFYHQAINVDSTLNLRKFFYDITKKTTSTYIEKYLDGRIIKPQTKDFIINFFSAGFVETYIRYIESGAEEEPERMVMRFYDIVEPQIRMAIDNSIKRDAELT
jgi:probable dihydroxyacetone kinase regulator